MPDTGIFNIQPPAWLQRNTTADWFKLGESTGETVTNLAKTIGVMSSQKFQSQEQGQNFFHKMVDASATASDPFYMEKAQAAQDSAALTHEKNRQTFEAASEFSTYMHNWQTKGQGKAGWLTENPYTGPSWMAADQIAGLQSKVIGKEAFKDAMLERTKSIDELRKIDPTTASQFAGIQQWTPDKDAALQTAVKFAQTKIDAENDKMLQEIADWETKGYTINRQWTDSRGRIRYSKTAPKTEPVKTEHVGAGVFERDPKTGKWTEVIKGEPKPEKLDFTKLLNELDSLKTKKDALPKQIIGGHWYGGGTEKYSVSDQKLFDAYQRRIDEINQKIEGEKQLDTNDPLGLFNK